MTALDQIRAIGYRVTAEGENLKLTWQGRGKPPAEQVRPLLDELRQRKAEALAALTGPESNPAPEPEHQAFIHQAQALFPGSREIPRGEWTLEDKFQFCLAKCRRIAGSPTTREGVDRVSLRLLAALFTAERNIKEQGGDPLALEGIRYAQRRLGFDPN